MACKKWIFVFKSNSLKPKVNTVTNKELSLTLPSLIGELVSSSSVLPQDAVHVASFTHIVMHMLWGSNELWPL